MTMPQTKIINAKGKGAGSVELADSLFGAPVNEALIHQAVVRQQAQGRLGRPPTQTRAHGHRRRLQAVAPEGNKAGRDREADRLRIGGAAWSSGRIRATTTRRCPPRCAGRRPGRPLGQAGRWSAPHRGGITIDEPKTRAFIESSSAWKAEGKVLRCCPPGRHVERSCANLREVRALLADSLNVVDLLEADPSSSPRRAGRGRTEVYA